MIGALLGGIGLFLLGMKLLTEGLQTLAGDALRDLLRRYTRSTWSAILSGALVTALVQSSSAVTLAVIGFVSAGILPFVNALGILFGANLGTTATAWIVATVGLKVSLDAFALPLVGIGVAMDLFGRGGRAALGRAIAGLGLVFLGIGALQTGMAGAAEAFDPAEWVRPGFGGRLILVLVGAVSTVVLQSSSAAVTATLTAVDSGTLTFEQAAAVVIGQNVGTTVKAILGAIGASAAARRTAVGHILFNVATAALALVLLSPFAAAVEGVTAGAEDPAISLAVFHSAFNLLGVLVFAPFLHPFANLITRLVPDRTARLTERLVDPGAGVPAVLLEASRRTTEDVAKAILAVARRVIAGEAAGEPARERLAEADEALRDIRDFLTPLTTDPTASDEFHQHLSVLHALDHLRRLGEACAEAPAGSAIPAPAREALEAVVTEAEGWLGGTSTGLDRLEAETTHLAQLRATRRPEILEETAQGRFTPRQADNLLRALAWAERVGSHTWRAVHHLRRARGIDPDRETPAALP